MASLVICNGGSPSTHQALAQGVPVIGVANNLDQYLNMAAITKAGAGRLLRSGTCDSRELIATINWMLSDSSCREAARALGLWLTQYDSLKIFSSTISEICGLVGLGQEAHSLQ